MTDQITLERQLAEARAENERLREALEVAAIWHDEQDKAISKQPNANLGQNGWMRFQHKEQSQEIRAAIHGEPA